MHEMDSWSPNLSSTHLHIDVGGDEVTCEYRLRQLQNSPIISRKMPRIARRSQRNTALQHTQVPYVTILLNVISICPRSSCAGIGWKSIELRSKAIHRTCVQAVVERGDISYDLYIYDRASIAEIGVAENLEREGMFHRFAISLAGLVLERACLRCRWKFWRQDRLAQVLG